MSFLYDFCKADHFRVNKHTHFNFYIHGFVLSLIISVMMLLSNSRLAMSNTLNTLCVMNLVRKAGSSAILGFSLSSLFAVCYC